MLKPYRPNPEGEGFRKLQQHHYKLWEDRWKLEENRGIGVHFLSGLYVGRPLSFQLLNVGKFPSG